MAQLHYNLPELDHYETDYYMIYFNGRIVAGSLMIGSSMAYPMLAEQASFWASVAFMIFSLSWILFNVLQVSRIIGYGHYTVVVGFVGLVLVVAFGRTKITDHVHFIPFYGMVASLLTFVWQPLGESSARLNGNGHHQGYNMLPTAESTTGSVQGLDISPHNRMDGVRIDSHQANIDQAMSPITAGQETPRGPLSSWLRNQDIQGLSHVPYSLPPSLDGDFGGLQQGQSFVMPHELYYMGPRSTQSNVSGPHPDSIVLSSVHAAPPSELSNNVHGLLDPDGGLAFVPTQTQRRLDIAGLPMRGDASPAATSAQSVDGGHTS